MKKWRNSVEIKKLSIKLKQIGNRYRAVLVIAPLFLLGLTPLLTWFKDGHVIATSDFFPLLNSQNLLLNAKFIWNPQRMGSAFLDPASVFPYYIFFGFFEFLGLDIITTQKLYFVFVFLLPGLTMYYLISVLMPRKRYEIGRLIASIFYMFNMYVLGNILQPATAMSYILLPLLLGVLIRGLKKKESKYVFFFGIASLLFSTSATNPPRYAIVWLIIVVYFIYHILFLEEKKKLSNLLFFTKAIGVSVLLNLWWIISLFVSTQSSGIGTITEQIGIDQVSANSINSSFLNVFRLLGLRFWGRDFQDSPYYPYADQYSTPLMIVVTHLIPILAFLALILRKGDRRVVFFAILSIASIFLSKGLHPPLEFVNKYLYTHLPGFSVFRNPPELFNYITAFGYSVLIGGTGSEIYNYFIEKSRKIGVTVSKIFAVFIILTIFVSAWPLITGDVIAHDRGILPDYHVKIPAYWFEASEWINDQEGDFRILEMPKNTPHVAVHYNWGYLGIDRASYFIHKPIVGAPSGYLNYRPIKILSDLTYQAFNTNSTTNSYKFLGLWNVKYILQRNDLDWTYFNTTDVGSPQYTKAILRSQEGIHLKKTFGMWDLYQLDDEYFVPHIYGSSSIFLLKNTSIDSPEFINTILSNDFISGNSVLINSADIRPNFLEIITENNQTYAPVITSQKINPTKYKVYINATQPFFLVFSESYHPQWEAYINEKDGDTNWIKAFFDEPIHEDKHFLVNGYANGWYIDKTGEYSITLFFKPQSVFYLGIIISAMTFVFSIGYLINDWRNKKLLKTP